nr:hypothetical protein [Propionibacterium sp.]
MDDGPAHRTDGPAHRADGPARRLEESRRRPRILTQRDRRFAQVLFVYMWIGGLIGTWFELALRVSLGIVTGDRAWWWPRTFAEFFEFQEPYALGTLAIILVVVPLKERFKLGHGLVFLLCAFVTGVVELGSALALVVTLGRNDFWNYSGHPYNVGGYISLASVSVFGVLGALFVHLLYPATRPALDRIGRRRMALLVTVLVVSYLGSLVAKLARYGWIL